MSSLSLPEYVNRVNKSQLVGRDKLKAMIAKFQQLTKGKSADWRIFAKLLLDDGLLTNWQNQKILQGKYRGFFLGKYKLHAHLGTGGMSSVYLAEHTVMLRRVALKILPQKLVEDEACLRRFFQESQATASLDHPNIVRAYDVDNEGKVHYLVMEYVDGADLEKRVKELGPLPYSQAAEYIFQAAEGLAHAHQKGMVHRDIKPGNLLVSSEGVVKVLDMGLALLSTFDASGSQEQHVVGTTDFIAPEQALHSQVDHRADIYSLGCTLYYLLTGQPPFPDATMAEVLLKHQLQEPRSIFEYRPDAPRELVAICRKMMAKAAKDRFQNCTDVADALSAWLTSNQGEAPHELERTAEEDASIVDFLHQLTADHAERIEPDAPARSKPAPSSNDEEFTGFLNLVDQEEGNAPVDAGDAGDDMANFFASIGGGERKPTARPGSGDTVAMSKQPTNRPTRRPDADVPSSASVRGATPTPQPRAVTPAPRPAVPPRSNTPAPQPRAITPAPQRANTPAPQPRAAAPEPEAAPVKKPSSKPKKPKEAGPSFDAFFSQVEEEEGLAPIKDVEGEAESDLQSFLSQLPKANDDDDRPARRR